MLKKIILKNKQKSTLVKLMEYEDLRVQGNQFSILHSNL